MKELKEKADALLLQKEYVLAIQAYTQCIQLQPENAILFSNRSYAYMLLGQPQPALEDAKTAIKFKPDWPRGYVRKATALSALNEHDEALCGLHNGIQNCSDPASHSQLLSASEAVIVTALKQDADFTFPCINAITLLFKFVDHIAHQPFSPDSNELYCWMAVKNVLNSSFERELDVVAFYTDGKAKEVQHAVRSSPGIQHILTFLDEDGISLIHQRITTICNYYAVRSLTVRMPADQFLRPMFDLLSVMLKCFLELLIHFKHITLVDISRAAGFLPQVSAFTAPICSVSVHLNQLLHCKYTRSPALYMQFAPLFYCILHLLQSILYSLYELDNFPGYYKFSSELWTSTDSVMHAICHGFYHILRNPQLKMTIFAIFHLVTQDLDPVRKKVLALNVPAMKRMLVAVSTVAAEAKTLSHQRYFCTFFLTVVEAIGDLIDMSPGDDSQCTLVKRVYRTVVAALEGEKSEADEEGFNSQATALLPEMHINAGAAMALGFLTEQRNFTTLLGVAGMVERDFFQDRLFPMLIKSHWKWGTAGNTPDDDAEVHALWALTIVLTSRCADYGQTSIYALQKWVISQETIGRYAGLIPTSLASFIISRAQRILARAATQKDYSAFDNCCRTMFHLLNLKLMDSAGQAAAAGKPHLSICTPGGPRITLTNAEALEFVDLLTTPFHGSPSVAMEDMMERGIVEHFVTICCYLSTHKTIATASLLKRMSECGFITGLLSLMKLCKPVCPISIAAPASAAIQAIHKGSK